MATFEGELSTLLRAVGRRIMAWVLNHKEPACPEEMASRLWVKGHAYRRRRKHRTTIATLFGTVDVWRRLYEPLGAGSRSIHPLELRLGIEAGLATPALNAVDLSVAACKRYDVGLQTSALLGLQSLRIRQPSDPQ